MSYEELQQKKPKDEYVILAYNLPYRMRKENPDTGEKKAETEQYSSSSISSIFKKEYEQDYPTREGKENEAREVIASDTKEIDVYKTGRTTLVEYTVRTRRETR
jgi:hypothetical protein